MPLTLSNLTLLTLSQPLPFINAPAWHGSILPRSSHTNSLVYQCIHAFNLQVYVSPILVGVESMYPALCAHFYYSFPSASTYSPSLPVYLIYSQTTRNFCIYLARQIIMYPHLRVHPSRDILMKLAVWQLWKSAVWLGYN